MQGRSFIACRPLRHPPSGFTVIELLIAVIIVIILAFASIPFVQRTIESYRLRAASWQLAGDLRLARQKAVTLQMRHRVCFTSCTTTVPANGYVFEREETSWALDSKGLPFAGGISMTANVGAITFGTKGEVNGATVTLTNPIGAYQVRTASTGRVIVCQGSCE